MARSGSRPWLARNMGLKAGLRNILAPTILQAQTPSPPAPAQTPQAAAAPGAGSGTPVYMGGADRGQALGARIGTELKLYARAQALCTCNYALAATDPAASHMQPTSRYHMQPTSRYHCRDVKESSGSTTPGSVCTRVTPGGTMWGGYSAQRLRPLRACKFVQNRKQ